MENEKNNVENNQIYNWYPSQMLDENVPKKPNKDDNIYNFSKDNLVEPMQYFDNNNKVETNKTSSSNGNLDNNFDNQNNFNNTNNPSNNASSTNFDIGQLLSNSMLGNMSNSNLLSMLLPMINKNMGGLDSSNLLNLLSSIGQNNNQNGNNPSNLLANLLSPNKNAKTQTMGTKKGEIEKYKKIKSLDN